MNADDPALEQFLADCRHFMSHFSTLGSEVSQSPAVEPVEVTTDALVAEAHADRAGNMYPTVEQAVANLLVVLRALCDHLLEVHPTAVDVAGRLASVIDPVEHVQGRAGGERGHTPLGAEGLAPPAERGRRRRTAWPTAFVPKSWERRVTRNGVVERRAWPLCLVNRLRGALRRRDVFAVPSLRFADPHIGLLDGAAWEAARSTVCCTLGKSPNETRPKRWVG